MVCNPAERSKTHPVKHEMTSTALASTCKLVLMKPFPLSTTRMPVVIVFALRLDADVLEDFVLVIDAAYSSFWIWAGSRRVVGHHWRESGQASRRRDNRFSAEQMP